MRIFKICKNITSHKKENLKDQGHPNIPCRKSEKTTKYSHLKLGPPFTTHKACLADKNKEINNLYRIYLIKINVISNNN